MSLPLQSLASSPPPNWLELPPELTAAILSRLGVMEVLTSAQKVCRTWRSICKEPSMWRCVDMRNLGDLHDIDYDLEAMCLHAIDRSRGGCVDVKVEYFASDSLLVEIAHRSSHLKCLRLVCCYNISDEGVSEAAAKLPLLEDLEISYCSGVSEEALKAVGQSCPLLKSLKLNCTGYKRPHIESDGDAIAIAQNMPELRHLQLFSNRLTEVGLNAILDGCPHLEYLDLRQCFNVKLVGNLEKRCKEKINNLRRPDDPTHDYGFDATVHDLVSSEDDYPYGYSDCDLVSEGDYDEVFSGASDYSGYEYDYTYYFSGGSDYSD